MSDEARSRSPFLVAAVAWLVPGAGYLLIGQRARGLTIGISIFVLIVLGILIGGVRVYDVPGYDRYGQLWKVGRHYDSQGRSMVVRDTDLQPGKPYDRGEREKKDLDLAIFKNFTSEVFDKPWYPLQTLSGLPSILLSKLSINVSRPTADRPEEEGARRSHGGVWEVGVLYTAIAGMLNLLAMIDSAYRAAHRPQPAAADAPPQGAAT